MNGSVSSMLADRLGQLCDAGLVSRTVTEGPPLSVTYALTGAGRALLPALEQITRWSERYLPRWAIRLTERYSNRQVGFLP